MSLTYIVNDFSLSTQSATATLPVVVASLDPVKRRKETSSGRNLGSHVNVMAV